MNQNFKCSIVIATYNRVEVLAETLLSLAQHLLTSDIKSNVEVLVVDNNSTDGTSQIAAGFKATISNLTVLSETQQGLSHARNAGIAAAKGEYIVFLDDDVELETGWLHALLREFKTSDVAVVGGKVLPFANRTLPEWLPREYAYLVSVFDPSDVITDLHTAMGANFAVRKSVFDAVGLFNPKLGRRGKKLLGGEEVELFRRISAAGGRIVYTPEAVVFHKIDNKINKEYIVDYAYWLGVSEANIDKNVVSHRKFLLKYIRSFIFPKLVYPVLRYIWEAKIADIKFRIKTQYARGYLDFKKALAT